MKILFLILVLFVSLTIWMELYDSVRNKDVLGGIISAFGLLSAILLFFELPNPEEPTAIDVYQGKTTL